MPDFEPIKISVLPPSRIITRDDLLIVDRLDRSDYETHIVRLARFVDLFASSDLNFTGDVTFVGTIQTTPTETLDVIFDNLTIRQSITLQQNADIIGLSLSDFEDVNVTEQTDLVDILLYDINPLTRKGEFKNYSLTDDLVDESPVDGEVYARRAKSWIPITDCIRCPEDGLIEIGDVVIEKITQGPILINKPVAFRAVVSGTPDAEEYEWTISPSTVNIIEVERDVILVEFLENVEYIVAVKVTDFFSLDSPQFAIYQAFPEELLGDVTITAQTDEVYINQPVEYTATISGVATTLNYVWSVSPQSASIISVNNNKATIVFDEAIDYVITCVVTSPNSSEKPKGTYNVNVTALIRDVFIIKDNPGETKPFDDISYTAEYTGEATDVKYLWTTSPSDALITGQNSKNVTIRYPKSGAYQVKCTFSSLSAGDSPKLASYTENVIETFFILRNPQLDYIQQESGGRILWQLYEFERIGTVSITRTTDGILTPNTEINFRADNSGTASLIEYSWYTIPVASEIKNINSREATIKFGEARDYTVGCIVTSRIASDSPQEATLDVSLLTDQFIGDVNIIQKDGTPGAVDFYQPFEFELVNSGNATPLQYSWQTFPSTSTIIGGNSKTPLIRFNERRFYNVACTVTCSNAYDTPKTAYFGVTVIETSLILSDPGLRYIIRQTGGSNNGRLIYQVNDNESIGSVYIFKVTPGTIKPYVNTVFRANNTGIASLIEYEWSTTPNTSTIKDPNVREATITFLEDRNYTIKCTMSSRLANDSPKDAIYEVLTISDTFIGNSFIEQNTPGAVDLNISTDFEAIFTGNATDVQYLWKTIPNTSTIVNDTSKISSITFNNYDFYNVACELRSITASDSPKVLFYTLEVTDLSRLTTEFDERILDEGDFALVIDE